MVSDSPVRRVPISGPGPSAPAGRHCVTGQAVTRRHAYPGRDPGIFGSWVLVWPGRQRLGAGPAGGRQSVWPQSLGLHRRCGADPV